MTIERALERDLRTPNGRGCWERTTIGFSDSLISLYLNCKIQIDILSFTDSVSIAYWGLAQSIVVIVATSLHNILITCWRLSPGWTLTWYLFLTIAWAVLAVTFGFTYADPSTGDICPGGTPYEEWGSYFSYNTFSCFDLTIPTVELAMICVARYVETPLGDLFRNSSKMTNCRFQCF